MLRRRLFRAGRVGRACIPVGMTAAAVAALCVAGGTAVIAATSGLPGEPPAGSPAEERPPRLEEKAGQAPAGEAAKADPSMQKDKPEGDASVVPESIARRLRVRPAVLMDSSDDAAYQRAIAGRVAELVSQAKNDAEPFRRVDRLLAASNLILSYELEPPCTRSFLSLPVGEETGRTLNVREALDRHDAILEQAGSVLAGLSQRDDLPAGWRRRATHRLDTLRAFGGAVRVYLSPEGDESPGRAAHRAASVLAPLLEDEDAAVAAAASLWQALLRIREGKAQRALAMLDLALSDPPDGSMPYGLFARLLRCRLIAERGGSDVALALLMRVEDLCDAWFDDDVGDAPRHDAVRTVQWFQIETLRRWRDRPGGGDDPGRREWFAERIEQIAKEGFDGEVNTVTRLNPAVPIVAPVRTAVELPAKPAEQAEPQPPDGK